MAKKDQTTRLLKALGDVDDKYIEESIIVKSKRASVTPLIKYSGIIGGIAAAAVLLVVGGYLMGLFGRSGSNTAEAPSRAEAAAEENRSVDMYAGSSGDRGNATYFSAETYGEQTEAAADYSTEEIDGVLTVNPMVEASSLSGLEDRAGFDITVPDSVPGSTACEYYYYLTEECIAEIRYLDQDGNEICVIRKAPGDGDISGVYECYSIMNRIDVEGLDNVRLNGSNNGYALATWTQGEYSYSIHTSELIAEQAMRDLISEVS